MEYYQDSMIMKKLNPIFPFEILKMILQYQTTDYCKSCEYEYLLKFGCMKCAESRGPYGTSIIYKSKHSFELENIDKHIDFNFKDFCFTLIKTRKCKYGFQNIFKQCE